MGLKEKFAQFLSDEVGSADHQSLLRWGTLAVGTTAAAFIIQPSADAGGTACGSKTCYKPTSCCSVYSLNWCSISCP